MDDATQPGGATATAAAEPPEEQPPSAIVRTSPDQGGPPPAGDDAEPVKGEVLDAVDLDLDEEFTEITVRIGGRKCIAREPSIATQKRFIRASFDKSGGDVEEDIPRDDAELDQKTVDDALESLGSLSGVYNQIAEVLRYANGEDGGEPPPREVVEENLTVTGFQKLFRALLGGRTEGEGSAA